MPLFLSPLLFIFYYYLPLLLLLLIHRLIIANWSSVRRPAMPLSITHYLSSSGSCCHHPSLPSRHYWDLFLLFLKIIIIILFLFLFYLIIIIIIDYRFVIFRGIEVKRRHDGVLDYFSSRQWVSWWCERHAARKIAHYYYLLSRRHYY